MMEMTVERTGLSINFLNIADGKFSC